MVHDYGASWEKLSDFVHHDHDILLPRAIEEMEMGPNENILDPFCRNGNMSLLHLADVAAKNNSKVFALTNSKTHYNYAVENFTRDNLIFLNNDILDPDLSFNGERIHKIFSFYHLLCAKDYRAVLKKMYEVLENNGKACILNVTRLDSYFKFFKYIQESPEWNLHGKHFVIPDWVQADWKGENHTEIFKEAVTSAGFTIEKMHIYQRRPTFDSKADCAGKFITGIQLYFYHYIISRGL